MLSIINANYQDNYKISLEFNDHKNGTVDYTLKWNNGLDLALEYLYFKTFETDNNLTAKFQGWGYI